MTRDWDLWPYRLADAQGEVAGRIYRMERDIEDVQKRLANALYPALRPTVKAMQKLVI